MKLAARARIPAKELWRCLLILSHDLGKEIQVLTAHVGPEHWFGVGESSPRSLSHQGGIHQKTKGGLRPRGAIAKRHKQAPPLGENFFGVEIGSAHDRSDGCHRI